MQYDTQSKHEGIRYPCDKCEYEATKQDQLKRHKQNKHEGFRYPSDQCEYIASTQSFLISHKKFKHDGIRYPCDQCNYSTIQLSALKRQRTAIHKGNIKVNAVDPVLIETSDMSVADTEIKKEDVLEEDPLSNTPEKEIIENENMIMSVKHDLDRNINIREFRLELTDNVEDVFVGRKDIVPLNTDQEFQGHFGKKRKLDPPKPKKYKGMDIISCEFCGFNGLEKGIAEHMKKKHDKQCDQYDFAATNISDLKGHTEVAHNGSLYQWYLCDNATT